MIMLSIEPIGCCTTSGCDSGGSSSGSAAAVAAGFCDAALGSDTGGSIRNPAAYCGVIGIKPSYGRVSRYGLVDMAMSLDQIGVISKNIEDNSLLLDVIKGKTENDSITQRSNKINSNEVKKIPKNITMGVLDLEIKDKKIKDLIDHQIKIIPFSKKEDENNVKK